MSVADAGELRLPVADRTPDAPERDGTSTPPSAILDARPQRIALVANGESQLDYVRVRLASRRDYDAVWTVNAGHVVYRCDAVWAMDDLRGMAARDPAYGTWMAAATVPVLTSTAYPEYPQSVALPRERLYEAFGEDYFVVTVAYAIAWAGVVKAAELDIFGADFTYPNASQGERGGQCAAYWIGRLRERGVTVRVGYSSTLLGTREHRTVPSERRLAYPWYGYDHAPWYPPIPEDA